MYSAPHIEPFEIALEEKDGEFFVLASAGKYGEEIGDRSKRHPHFLAVQAVAALDRFGALAGGTIYPVRLLVEPDRAAYFERKDYHRTQLIEERRADGRLVVSYKVAGL